MSGMISDFILYKYMCVCTLKQQHNICVYCGKHKHSHKTKEEITQNTHPSLA